MRSWMIGQRHRIKRQTLEIRAPSPEQARDLQAQLSQMQGERITPLIDQLCSELSASDRVHRIESLELDLGSIDTHNFADNYLAALERALRRSLTERIRASQRADSGRDPNPRLGSYLELIELFARTGTLPWWADTGPSHIPRACMRTLLTSAPQALARLVRDLVSEPTAAWRLVQCSDDPMLAELVGLLAPGAGREPVRLARELLDLLRASAPIANTPAKHWRHLLWRQMLRLAALPDLGRTDFPRPARAPTERGATPMSGPERTPAHIRLRAWADHARGARELPQAPPSDAGDSVEPQALMSSLLVRMALDLGVTYSGLIAKLHAYVETHPEPASRSMRDAIATAYRTLRASPADPARGPASPLLADQGQPGQTQGAYHAPPRRDEPGAPTDFSSAARSPVGVTSRPGSSVIDEQPAPSSRRFDRQEALVREQTRARAAIAPDDLARPNPALGSGVQTHRERTPSSTGPLAGPVTALRARTHRIVAAGETNDRQLAGIPVADLETALSRQNETALAQLLAAFEALAQRGDAGESRSTPRDPSVETSFEIDADAETDARGTTRTDQLDDTSAPMSITGASSDLERLSKRAMAPGTVTPELLEQCMAALQGYGETDPIPQVRGELHRILQQALTRARAALPHDRLEAPPNTPTAPRQPARSLRNDRRAASQRTGPSPRAPLQAQQARRVPWSPRPPHQRRQNALDEIYVDNSGLAILWPFLGRFFTRVGLVEDKQFIGQASGHRAGGLLQYLVTPGAFEDGEPPEYMLPLNKVLCGIEIDDVFEFGPPPSDTEIEECDGLLTAAIHNAPILRDMSIQGFRGTFLLRDGVLRSRDGAWLLNVERQTYDVVLDRFPWSWTWVKLPWMQAPLRVEW